MSDVSPSSLVIPSQGPIEGISLTVPSLVGGGKDGRVTAYLGIPFAQPPTGERRWKRAQKPAPSWHDAGVRRSQWQADPYQMLDMIRFSSRLRCDNDKEASNGSYDENLVSEDCLYLNVWVPESHTPEQHKPVLAWVYGGGFVFGGTSQPQYDGARLANVTGCIVVSIAYRVSLFGFLGSRQLAIVEGSDAGTGNYGLWDVVAGLEWVQENIAVFGGDAANVTAFGESAGAITLHYLMLSPAVPANLFSRVALFSGTVSSVLPRSLHSSQATFDALATSLGAQDCASEEDKYAVLIAASARDLLEAFVALPAVRPRTEYIVDASKGRPARRCDQAQDELRFEAGSLSGPTWDGVMVADTFLDCLKNNVPPQGSLRNGSKGIFFGHTADEGTVFTVGIATKAGLIRSLNFCNPAIREDLSKAYGVHAIQNDDSAMAISSAILGDYVFVSPVNALTASLQRQSDQVPAYRYVWTHRPSSRLLKSIPPNKMVEQFFGKAGSYHSGELAFLFGWDGTSDYTYARQSYPHGNDYQARLIDGFGKDVGFTEAERVLSDSFARKFGSFARGKQPWSPVSGSSLSSVATFLFDDMPSLGATSEEAVARVGTKTNDESIPIYETTLEQTLVWNAKVNPDRCETVASNEDKYSFWSDDGMKRTLLYYYGDERYTFVP